MKDLIILGNGMAGMTAALYAKRANLDFKIVGRDEYDFGQIANAICVENFPCVKPQSGMDLAMSLHDQLTIENDIIIEEHEVIKITRAMINHYGLGFHIDYADGTDDFCKAVIYALGASAGTESATGGRAGEFSSFSSGFSTKRSRSAAGLGGASCLCGTMGSCRSRRAAAA